MGIEALEQFQLGQNCYYGRDVEQDYAEAAKYFRLAAEQGVADAEYSLGFVLSFVHGGVGIDYDAEQAVMWYRRAADKGHALAQYRLGLAYSFGDGVEQDAVESAKWLNLASDQGVPDAQYLLGRVYLDGSGVQQDQQKAIRMFDMAAKQGDSAAMQHLSYMYENGINVEQDDEIALSWMLRAAFEGDTEAMAALGNMYAEGNCVSEDFEQAHYWLNKAVEHGAWDCSKALAELFLFKSKNSRNRISEAYFWIRLNNQLFPDQVDTGYLEMENDLKSRLSKKKFEETETRVADRWNRLTNNGKDLFTNFEVDEAKKLKDGPIKSVLRISDSDWVDIPSGEFTMGDNKFKRQQPAPEHQVAVQNFQMLKTPVTFAMYDAYCDATGAEKPDDQGWGRGWLPVINVSYWDAVSYINWLNEQTGWHCRLPTEAEWEYACRAGSTTPFWTGKTIKNSQANFHDYNSSSGVDRGGIGRTSPVDLFESNSWGLHDMTGNVCEWCASLFERDYTGLECQDATHERNFKTKTKSLRVIRGGSWKYYRDGIRSSFRERSYPEGESDQIGFRLARNLT